MVRNQQVLREVMTAEIIPDVQDMNDYNRIFTVPVSGSDSRDPVPIVWLETPVLQV